jgi:2-polyprenyl-3-methyl-5-hydroxy-6-metoxy-1,4-benzoquinol methylase
MDFELACAKLYRVAIPRLVRDLIGRAHTPRNAWTTAGTRWHFQKYSPARWERDYRTDKWCYMHALPELARYSVVVGYAQYLAAQGELLDLGCGEGILQARLGQTSYARYVGVDISSAAIEVARVRNDERTEFVCADVARYAPEGLFDVVILNEVLYYFSDPLGVLSHYEQFLKPHGVFIISMFITDETRANWQMLEPHYDFVDQIHAANALSGFAWDCRVARPRKDTGAKRKER